LDFVKTSALDFVKALDNSFSVIYPFTLPLLSTTSTVASVRQTCGKNSSKKESSLTLMVFEFFSFWL